MDWLRQQAAEVSEAMRRLRNEARGWLIVEERIRPSRQHLHAILQSLIHTRATGTTYTAEFTAFSPASSNMNPSKLFHSAVSVPMLTITITRARIARSRRMRHCDDRSNGPVRSQQSRS